jgi:hypothetical protein
MEQIVEYSKEVVDRYIKSMGYNPQTIDRNRRMALTKTARFQNYAQRMQEEVESLQEGEYYPEKVAKALPKGLKSEKDILKHSHNHVTKELGKKQADHLHHFDQDFPSDVVSNYSHLHKMSGKLSVEALEFPDNDGIAAKGSSSKVVGERKKGLSRNANLIKALYKKHRVVKEELYDHEKDDKDGGTYGKKPKFAKNTTDNVKDGETGENKAKAAAVLSGGTTLTGQKRDDVEFDPVLNKPNVQTDGTGATIKANKKDK